MLWLAACSPHTEPPSRISLAPSLRPVDAARPMVVFRQVRGEACGNDAVVGAIRNMKRLSNVDGYLEVLIEETGENAGRCARVTAYPFRYGTSTDLPGLIAGDESTDPALIPGRPAPPAPVASTPNTPSTPPPVDCPVACQKFSTLVASGSIQQALAKERCITRCTKPDTAFQSCITKAADKDAANACQAP
jgi:hypothetical protein